MQHVMQEDILLYHDKLLVDLQLNFYVNEGTLLDLQ